MKQRLNQVSTLTKNRTHLIFFQLLEFLHPELADEEHH